MIYPVAEYGALAQLGERYTGSVEVSGSIPLCSTITDRSELFKGFGFFIIPGGNMPSA